MSVQKERQRFALICHQYLDPSSQQLLSVYKEMKTKIHVVCFNSVTDSKGGITTNWWDRCERIMNGMPVLNSVSVGSPVTKFPKPVDKN